MKAQAIEDQLMRDTWEVPGYDLLPQLRSLDIPTLVITGDHDFVPVEVAGRIAEAIPNAKLVMIQDCGHFSYLECPAEGRRALDEFFRSFSGRSSRAPERVGNDPELEGAGGAAAV